MNILVAGGAGFIGSHLIDSLLAEGHRVICADKLIMGKQNIAHIPEGENFRFYEAELADQETEDRIFRENNIDAVYHLAANSDIQKGGKEPSIDFNDTLLTTRTLLEGMRKAGVKKLDNSKKLIPESHAAKLRYLSTDTNVATVSKKGKIKGVKAGTCYVYAYAQNGIGKTIIVIVK